MCDLVYILHERSGVDMAALDAALAADSTPTNRDLDELHKVLGVA